MPIFSTSQLQRVHSAISPFVQGVLCIPRFVPKLAWERVIAGIDVPEPIFLIDVRPYFYTPFPGRPS